MKPYQVFIFIVCCFASLAVLCVVLPERFSYGSHTLRWPTLAEVITSPQPSPQERESCATDCKDSIGNIGAPGTLCPIETVDSIAAQKDTVAPIIPKVPGDSVTDSRIFLSAFYSSLADTGERKVRVLHYGDSQIEEDRMTSQIRECLQKRYGGQGIGLMPLVQTIPTLSTKQELRMNGRIVNPAQGPRRYMVYAPKRDRRDDGLYGPMGQMAFMADSLVPGTEEISAICVPQRPEARYEKWKVFADSSVHYRFSGDTVMLSGKGGVYALSQESDKGVIVDNIPMRGCLGLVFTQMDSSQLSTFYHRENVRLIIMQYGGNAIPSNRKASTIHSIVTGLREQVRYVQSCAPEAAILFIGPSDMLTQENGEWITYPLVPYMDDLLQKMASEEHIAYFSLYRWMGGNGSMLHWREIGLAGSDGVHFTRAGARKAGNAVAEWMLTPPDLPSGEKKISE